MTQGQLTEILAEDDCVEIARLRAQHNAYYDMPIRAIAKRYGLDSYELRTLVGSGLNVAGVRVTFDSKKECLIFRAQKPAAVQTPESHPTVEPSRSHVAPVVPPAEQPSAGPFAARVQAEDVDVEARKEWDYSPAVRSEFSSFEAYRAYRRAEARGAVRVFSRNTVVRGERPVTAGW